VCMCCVCGVVCVCVCVLCVVCVCVVCVVLCCVCVCVCVCVHISDSVETVYELPLLPNNTVSVTFYKSRVICCIVYSHNCNFLVF
jgi:hypothetical protein